MKRQTGFLWSRSDMLGTDHAGKTPEVVISGENRDDHWTLAAPSMNDMRKLLKSVRTTMPVRSIASTLAVLLMTSLELGDEVKVNNL